MLGLRAVLADGERLFRYGIRSLLESNGVNVVGEAVNADELRHAVRLTRPDVVVIGSGKPGIDEVATTRSLRESGFRKPIIVLVAPELETDAIAGLSAGANAYVMRDAPIDQFVTALAAAARGQAFLPAALNEQVVARLRWLESGDGVPHRPSTLTEREDEILRLIAKGIGNRGIARRLYLSETVVKCHVSAIIEKLGVGNRTQAAVYATRHSLEPVA